MNWRAAAIWGVCALVPIALLSLGFGRDPHAIPSMLIGKAAPDFELETLNNKRISMDSLRGKAVVINFWASWCVPCLAEHETLQQAAKDFQSDVQFLGVVYQDTREAAEALLKTHGHSYPQLVDPNSRVALDYGVTGVPESFIIDRAGVVVHKEAGVLNRRTLEQFLRPILAQKGAPR